MSVLVTAERFLNSLHYKKSPVGNRHPGPECRALEERCGSSTNQVRSPTAFKVQALARCTWVSSLPLRPRRPTNQLPHTHNRTLAIE